MKIYWKYSLFIGLLLIAAAGSITGLALQHHRRSQTRETLLRAESIAVNLGLVSAEAILTGDILQLLPLTTDATTRHESVVYAAVTDKNGVLLAHPDRQAIRKTFTLERPSAEDSYDVQARVLNAVSMGRRVWDVSVPVKAKGSLVELGRVHVGIDQRSLATAVRRSLVQLSLVSVLCLLLGLGIAFAFVRLLVRPLQELSRASALVGQGDLHVSVPVRSRDEIGELGSNFNAMVSQLALAEERRKAALRVESELELAHSIQKGLLPSKPPALPGWEIAHYYEPAYELGGDYYDWYPVAGGAHWGFAVADVSGKGVPASLHMASLRNLMRIGTAQIEAPEALTRWVNGLSYPDLLEKAFITLAYAVLDPRSGELRTCNAGHDPLIVVRADGSVETLPSNTYPLGVVDEEEFAIKQAAPKCTLAPGDLLFFYTDGATEAVNAQAEQFGPERIIGLLAGASAQQAVDRVLAAVKAHVAGQPPHDDITLLALRRLPAEPGSDDAAPLRPRKNSRPKANRPEVGP